METMSTSNTTELNEKLIEHTNAPSQLRHANENDSMGQTAPTSKRAFSRRDSVTQAVNKKQDDISTVEPPLASSLPLGGRLLFPISGDGHPADNFELEEDIELQPGKRYRNSSWPLKSQSGGNDLLCQIRSPLRGRRSMRMASGASQCRPSKFVEGSMNDRASQMPHLSFIVGSEDIREQFDTDQNILREDSGQRQIGGLASQENQPVLLGLHYNKSEASRPSSIVRFGKSLASAFNPSSWKVWSRSQEEENLQETVIRERKERAEKTYKELRQTGQLCSGMSKSCCHDQSRHARHRRHDSGSEVDRRASTYCGEGLVDSKHLETPLEEKRYGRIFLDPPSVLTLQPTKSLASEVVPILKKSSVQVNKSSPPKIYIENARERQFRSEDDIPYGSEDLRSLPSRKSLQKHQKLVKRVSDLEGKLEAARRQLAEALEEPVPKSISSISRASFIPDGLHSLSSERLLSTQTVKMCDIYRGGPCSEIGKAIFTSERPSSQTIDIAISTMDVQQNGKASPENSDPSNANILLEKPIKLKKTGDSQELKLLMEENTLSKQDEQDRHRDTSKNPNLRNRSSRKRKSTDSCIPGEDDSRKISQTSDDNIVCGGAKSPGTQRKLKHSQKPQKVNMEPVFDEGLFEKKRPAAGAGDGDEDGIKDARTRPHRKLQSSQQRHSVLQKKPNPPANNNRISRRRLEYSRPSTSLFPAVAGVSKEGSPDMKPLQEGFDQLTAKVTASDDVPPVPQLPKSINSATGEMVTRFDTHFYTGISPQSVFHGRDIQHWKSVVGPTNDGDERKVENKKPFEWPADVF